MDETEKMTEAVPEETGIRRIHQLPRQIADRIAAGEVVDRPISIVKELVENSIDAGSTSIVVEIRKGGKSYIRVTDNGSGIPADDTEIAFSRHATSKIREAEDLDAIGTLGFRGEALASIAAVSRTELITKTEEERVGTYMLMEGGFIAARSEKGCPSGTTMIVRDLFFNTPARLKFLKSDQAEGSLIIDFVSKVALAYPEIRIRMIHNNNTLFTTPGRGDRRSTIATIYDPHLADNLISAAASADEKGLELEGYLSSPDNTRKNRRSQIFFVNGRYIKNRILEECISEACRTRMFEGRHPVAFLFLKVDPSFIDVNVHPNKKEIRFDDDALIREFVTEALKKALQEPEAVPEIRYKGETKAVSKEKESGSTKKTEESRSVQKEIQKKPKESVLHDAPASEDPSIMKRSSGSVSASSVSGSRQEQLDIHALLRQRREEKEAEAASRQTGTLADSKTDTEKQGISSVREQKTDYRTVPDYEKKGEKTKAVQEQMTLSGMEKASGAPDQVKEKTENVTDGSDNYFNESSDRPEHVPFQVSSIQPVGVIFNEYILGSDEDNLYLIDQHAAHERIFYERLTESFYKREKASQLTVVPITIQTTFAAGSLAEEWMRFLRGIGFAIEEFGPKTYLVREIPSYMDLEEAESFLKDFTEETSTSGSFSNSRQRARIVSRACKSAVKAHDKLSPAEVQSLLRDLAACRNPFSCPHGRPTIIRMKHREIDRWFKREG